MGNSSYTQLSPYLLLEYIYGDSSTTYISNQVKLSRIKNAYLDGQVQFLNGSASADVTQNVLNTSAANIGGYKWALLSTDAPTPYISIDPKIAYTDLSGVLTSIYVRYDVVRVHIVSGYRLEDLQGLIIQVYGREALTSKVSVFCNNVYLNSDARDILNPKPIILGDRIYDRYIEVLVPSLKGINEDFFANPQNPYSIGYQYTSNNTGLLYNSSIYTKVYEVNKLEKLNGIVYLYTANSYEVSVNQEDMYAGLAANIQEATDGDYFLYYPTYAGNFIEDFISGLDSEGGDYVVINDVDVYEQVGMESILTFSFSQVQQGGFDGPLEFRPVLKYAGSAVTFSVDYTVRIFNRVNGFQIIRRASTTSFHPRKYGKQLEKITLAHQTYPFKVYNKVYGNSPVTFVGNEYTSSFSTVYVPIFYETRNVVIQSKTLLANGANPISPNFYESINFGQGDARIYISDFESYHKFVVSQVDPKSGSLTNIDLTSGNVVIAFKDMTGNMIKIPAEPSDEKNSQAKGELVFRLPDYLKKKVLTTDEVQPFYILTEASGAAETLLYTGTVDKIENVSKETARAKDVVTASGAVTPSASNTTTTTAGTTASTSSGVSSVINPSLTAGKSLLQTLTDANSASVSSVTSTPEVMPPVIPNYTFDSGAISIKTGVTPVSETDSSMSKSQVTSKLSQTSGTVTTINE